MKLILKNIFKYGVLAGMALGLVILNKLLPGDGGISVVIGIAPVVSVVLYEVSKSIENRLLNRR